MKKILIIISFLIPVNNLFSVENFGIQIFRGAESIRDYMEFEYQTQDEISYFKDIIPNDSLKGMTIGEIKNKFKKSYKLKTIAFQETIKNYKEIITGIYYRYNYRKTKELMVIFSLDSSDYIESTVQNINHEEYLRPINIKKIPPALKKLFLKQISDLENKRKFLVYQKINDLSKNDKILKRYFKIKKRKL